MAGFERGSSGIGSNRAVNCATTTAPPQKNTIDVVSFCPCQSELLALQVNMHTAEKVVLVERKNEKTISSKLETNT